MKTYQVALWQYTVGSKSSGKCESTVVQHLSKLMHIVLCDPVMSYLDCLLTNRECAFSESDLGFAASAKRVTA